MKVPYNYLHEQFAETFERDYLPEIRKWVPTGEFTLGPFVDAFEKKFAQFLGVKHVISVNTGTDALILALKAVGVKPGDEVISVANTFYATIGAVVAVGARPVFVDCDDRYQIDVSAIEKAITPKTKAILPVHWAGCPPQMDQVMKIAARHGLKVVEDACPAAGAAIHGKKAGTFGDANAFSMHPLKPLNVMGDGGMITTNCDEIAEFLRIYRNHGMVDRDHIVMWGINARLQPFQAVVGIKLLDTLEQANEARIRNARRLDAGLHDLRKFVSVPVRPEGYREVYQLYLACFQRRDELVAYLHKNEIEAKVHYPVPLHLQKPGRELGYKEGDFPNAEKQAKEVITLPAHQYINEAQIDFILKKISDFYLN